MMVEIGPYYKKSLGLIAENTDREASSEEQNRLNVLLVSAFMLHAKYGIHAELGTVLDLVGEAYAKICGAAEAGLL